MQTLRDDLEIEYNNKRKARLLQKAAIIYTVALKAHIESVFDKHLLDKAIEKIKEAISLDPENEEYKQKLLEWENEKRNA